ncbi:T9SS type A sorting domain-containing protein [Candidatus Fermentibacteria bacterium]|nr:T9SS type A sorting domain-containing protein [Candidatus Fermentibacteria bacterium]
MREPLNRPRFLTVLAVVLIFLTTIVPSVSTGDVLPELVLLGEAFLADGAMAVEVAFPYAFVGAKAAGLLAYDVSDPSNPVFLDGWSDPSFAASQIDIEGTLAFVTDGFHHDTGGMWIFDISDPADLKLEGHIPTPHEARGVVVDGTIAFVGSGFGGLRAIDVTDPSNPVQVGSLSTNNAHWVATRDGLVFVGDWYAGLRIVDATNPSALSTISTITTGFVAYDVEVVDTHAYVTDKTEGLVIFDVSAPATPSLVGSFNPPGMDLTVSVEVEDEIAYVSDYYGGLWVVDISDPQNCEYLTRYNPGTNMRNLCVLDKLVYVADNTGFKILRYQDLPQFCRIAGSVKSSAGGRAGVPVELHDALGVELGMTESDASGAYSFSELPWGDYTVSIITPLGYVADAESKGVTIAGEDIVCDFFLTPMDLAYDPRSVGFWKHQLKVYLTGRGAAQIDEADFTGYLSDISMHFTNSPANPLGVYVVNQPADHVDSLQAAYDLLNTDGNVPMVQKAKRQMMALLLNVTSLQLPQFASVSYDGATASQAITYCWQLITDDETANDELAKDVAEAINEGDILDVGLIPTDTPEISYGHPDVALPVACVLLPNSPNPFGTETMFSYGIPTMGHVRLVVMDALGREITTLVDKTLPAGYHTVSWDASSIPSGVYFCRLVSGSDRSVRPVMVLR